MNEQSPTKRRCRCPEAILTVAARQRARGYAVLSSDSGHDGEPDRDAGASSAAICSASTTRRGRPGCGHTYGVARRLHCNDGQNSKPTKSAGFLVYSGRS